MQSQSRRELGHQQSMYIFIQK